TIAVPTSALFGANASRRVFKAWPPSKGRVGSRLNTPPPALIQTQSRSASASTGVPGTGRREGTPPSTKPAAGPARLTATRFHHTIGQTFVQVVVPPAA